MSRVAIGSVHAGFGLTSHLAGVLRLTTDFTGGCHAHRLAQITDLEAQF